MPRRLLLAIAAVLCNAGQESRGVDFAGRVRIANGGFPGINRFKIKETIQAIPCAGGDPHCDIQNVNDLLETASNGPDKVSVHEGHTHYNFKSNENLGMRVMNPPVSPNALYRYALYKNPAVVTGHGRHVTEPHHPRRDAWESHEGYAAYRAYDRHDPDCPYGDHAHNTRRIAVTPHRRGRYLNYPPWDPDRQLGEMRGIVMEDNGHVYQVDDAQKFVSPGQ